LNLFISSSRKHDGVINEVSHIKSMQIPLHSFGFTIMMHRIVVKSTVQMQSTI